MKNIKHHSIIVSSNDRSKLEQIRKQIMDIYAFKMEARNGSQLISPIIESLINNFCSFFIAPDGSKEGYDASDDGDNIRKLVVEALQNNQITMPEIALNYVELSFGDENDSPKIINSN